MNRATAALFLLLLPLPTTEGAAPAEGRATSRFAISIVQSYGNIPRTISNMKVWFPIPLDDEGQKILNRVTMAPYNIETAALSDTGTVIASMVGGPRGGVPMQVRLSFDLERKEDRRGAAMPASPPHTPEVFRALSTRWLMPETLSAIDAPVKSAARKIVAGRKTPLDKARAVYDHVVTKMTLLAHPRDLQGSGYGRVSFTVKEMKGDRTDMAAAFVGLCRASGIPARTVTGLRFPADEESGTVRDWHVWAEFLTEAAGWIPADPSAAMADPSKKAFYFGSLDADRVTMSIGRDVVLIPAQAGPPLNFFVNPYWEGNGREMPPPFIDVSFKRLEQIQNQFIPAAGAAETKPPGSNR